MPADPFPDSPADGEPRSQEAGANRVQVIASDEPDYKTSPSSASKMNSQPSIGKSISTKSGGVPSRVSSFFNTPSALLAGSTGINEEELLALRREEAEQEVHNHTIFSKLALSDKFQNITLAIICINALWIGVDTEWNHGSICSGITIDSEHAEWATKVDADWEHGTKCINEPKDADTALYPGSYIVEFIFCLYFTFEVVVRFLSFKKSKYCLKDGWFVFDSILVFFMILETWILKIVEVAGGGGGSNMLSNFSALRLLRLLRLTRMARLMRAVPELMMLIKGMISATKAVGFILIFLVLVMYVFAILMMSMIAEPCDKPMHVNEATGCACNPSEDDESKMVCAYDCHDDMDHPQMTKCEARVVFGSMGDAMMTLFTNGVLGDNLNWAMATILYGGSLLCLWIFFLFFMISSLTLLNMLIGVLCEVIGKKAEEERNTAGENEMRSTLTEAFEGMDQNGDGSVTATEWDRMKTNPEVRRSLQTNGIEPDNLDIQLEKMKKAIFMKKSSAGRSAKDKDREGGLSLEEFVNRLLDIQPTKPTSCLELQLLRAKIAMRDRKLYEYLRKLEGSMNHLLGARGMELLPPVDDEPGTINSLADVSTQALFDVLKTRTSSDPPPSGTSSPMVMQSAFPTPEPDLAEANELDIGITEEDRAEARQHPLFQQLASRNPPGGWGKALLIAKLCTIKKPVTLQEICQQAKDTSVSELQALIEALPELFEYLPVSGTVTAITPVPPVEPARGRQAANSSAGQDDRGQSVWRLCDALAQGSSARSLQ